MSKPRNDGKNLMDHSREKQTIEHMLPASSTRRPARTVTPSVIVLVVFVAFNAVFAFLGTVARAATVATHSVTSCNVTTSHKFVGL